MLPVLIIHQYFSEILILDAPWPGPCPAHAADNMARVVRISR